MHKLHPTVKLLTTGVFIVVAVSFDRYAFGRLIPYVFYPTLLMALSETPYAMLLKRFLIALPFCLFAGISNAIFDRVPAFAVNGVTVSYGAISLFTIIFKTYLCVMAVLLLVASTPLAEITASMRRLKLPDVFVALFEMTYRYIGVLFEEAYSMHVAYILRSRGKKGVDIKNIGSFLGQLLLRSFDRAERVYNAMKCRGYAQGALSRGYEKLKIRDWIFGFAACFAFIAFRIIDTKTFLAFVKFFTGVL